MGEITGLIELSKPEIAELFQGYFSCFGDIVDSVNTTAKHPYDKVLAGKIYSLFSSLEDKSITSIKIGVRNVREKDKMSEGQHPGYVAQIDFADGFGALIYVWGGIRDLEASADLKDQNGQFSQGRDHADRTRNVIDKPLEFNLVFVDPDRGEVANVWVRDTKGTRPSVAVYIMDWLNPQSVMENHKNVTSFTKRDDSNYYIDFHERLDVFFTSFLRICRENLVNQ